ncbi:hypothetical protein BKA62DRAFT_58932 [Auriculariales sp. MPI-PUGE-AT-0066]|nr:hypothetical protein BKA62DRAFT_58932 [Auriculariales sp. MPI-PUGE-AT-0066]
MAQTMQAAPRCHHRINSKFSRSCARAEPLARWVHLIVHITTYSFWTVACSIPCFRRDLLAHPRPAMTKSAQTSPASKTSGAQSDEKPSFKFRQLRMVLDFAARSIEPSDSAGQSQTARATSIHSLSVDLPYNEQRTFGLSQERSAVTTILWSRCSQVRLTSGVRLVDKEDYANVKTPRLEWTLPPLRLPLLAQNSCAAASPLPLHCASFSENPIECLLRVDCGIHIFNSQFFKLLLQSEASISPVGLSHLWL